MSRTADPDRTISWTAATGKESARPVIGAAKAARLIETVLALETVKDIPGLRPLLQRA